MGLRWCQVSLKKKKMKQKNCLLHLTYSTPVLWASNFTRDVMTPQICCSWVTLTGALHPLTGTRAMRPWPSLAKPSTWHTHACNTLLPLFCLHTLWCLLGRKPTLSPSLLGATRRLYFPLKRGDTTARTASWAKHGDRDLLWSYCLQSPPRLHRQKHEKKIRKTK